MVNHSFKIVQMGNALPEMLLRDYDDLIGLHVEKVFKFTKPVLAGETSTVYQISCQSIIYRNYTIHVSF